MMSMHNSTMKVASNVRMTSAQSQKKTQKRMLITLSVFTSSESDSLSLRLLLLLTKPLLALDSGHYSPFHPIYSSIMPDSRSFLLFPKLCQHNSLIPIQLYSSLHKYEVLSPRCHALYTRLKAITVYVNLGIFCG